LNSLTDVHRPFAATDLSPSAAEIGLRVSVKNRVLPNLWSLQARIRACGAIHVNSKTISIPGDKQWFPT
jgi:hypothetical protein